VFGYLCICKSEKEREEGREGEKRKERKEKREKERNLFRPPPVALRSNP
jgi:hypothetical protein